MLFNNAAQTCRGILGDQLSMTSPQDKQLACLPARIAQIGHKQEKCSVSLSKGGGTKEGTVVILSDSNYHIPTARMQGSFAH